MVQVERLLKCSDCQQYWPESCFARWPETYRPTSSRRCSYQCLDCKADRERLRRTRPEVKEVQKQWHKENASRLNELRRRSNRHKRDYYTYLGETCDKTPGCEKHYGHSYFCRVNGVTLTPAEYLVKNREQHLRRRMRAANYTGSHKPTNSHPWRIAGRNLSLKRVISERKAA